MRRTGLFLAFFALCWQLSQCKSGPSNQSKQDSTGQTVHFVLDTAFAAAVSHYSFDSVSWLTLDPVTGNLFVLQRKFPAVSVLTPEGKLLSQWQTHDLGYPHSITIRYEGNTPYAWITDFSPPQTAGSGWGHCIKKFTLDGAYVGAIGTCAQNSQGRGLKPVQFDLVTDVAFDTKNNLFVTDGDLGGLNNRLLKLDTGGNLLQAWSAPNDKPGSAPLQFNLPHATIVDTLGRIWIMDKLNSRVQVMAPDGKFLGQWTFDSTMGPNGLDISSVYMLHGKPMANVVVASSPINLSSGLSGEVWVIPALMDKNEPTNFGSRTPLAYWKQPDQEGSAMLHSAAISRSGNTVYLGFLNQHSAPLKYSKQ